jgi:hypothetical protein
MLGVTLNLASAAVIHGNEHRASVWTIVWTGSVDHLFHGRNRSADYATNRPDGVGRKKVPHARKESWGGKRW